MIDDPLDSPIIVPMANDDPLCIGKMYSNDEIRRRLHVGNAGGIRLNVGADGVPQRAVVMTSSPEAKQERENPYRDRIENGVLVYTAAGLEGDQSLSGMNLRLTEQRHSHFPIHGFMLMASRRDKRVGPNRWMYLGLLEYLRHYPEQQLDSRGELRSAWIIELGIHGEPEAVPVAADHATMEELLKLSRFVSDSEADRDIGKPTPMLDWQEGDFTPEQIEHVRGQLLGIEARQFEHFIGGLLSRSGFVDVATTRFSQDGGIDINAIAGRMLWPLVGTHVQIQAKRWHHTVGRKEVAELRGSLALHARGAVVTTSQYSRAAISEAAADGKLPLVLVDGYALAKITLNFGLHIPA
jgi:hypothetical protein